MSNNSSHGEHCFVSSLLFPKVSQHIHRAINLSHIYASPTFSLPLLQYVVSEPSLRAHWFSSGEGRCVTPCTDRIDNAGLNIALRQDIFRSVYSAVTRTLPQLNDQTEDGNRWGCQHCNSLFKRLLSLLDMQKNWSGWCTVCAWWYQLKLISVTCRLFIYNIRQSYDTLSA